MLVTAMINSFEIWTKHVIPENFSDGIIIWHSIVFQPFSTTIL